MEPLGLAKPRSTSRPRESLPALFTPGQWRRLSCKLGLSRRQAQIAMRLTSDLRRDDIARELGITAETVRTHMRGLFEKLGVRTRIGMVVRLVLHARSLDAEPSAYADASELLGS